MIDIVNMMFLDSPESGEGSSTRHSDGTACCFVFQGLQASKSLGDKAQPCQSPPWRRSIAGIACREESFTESSSFPSLDSAGSCSVACFFPMKTCSRCSTLYAAASIGLRHGWLDLIKIDRLVPPLHLDMHGSSHQQVAEWPAARR